MLKINVKVIGMVLAFLVVLTLFRLIEEKDMDLFIMDNVEEKINKQDLFSRQEKVNIGTQLNDFKMGSYNKDSVFVFWEGVSRQVLFFRFSEFDCRSCVQGIMEKLNNLDPAIDGKICLLGDFTDTYEQERFQRLFIKSDAIDMYHVTAGNVHVPAEEVGAPYLFRLDRDRRVRDFILVNKNNLSPVDRYLERLIFD